MKSGPSGFNNFRNALCMKHGWPRNAYDNKVLWLCVHRRGALLARLVCAVNPGHFKRERAVIEQLAETTGLGEFQDILREYKDHSGGMLRKIGVRLSGQKLLTLGKDVFG